MIATAETEVKAPEFDAKAYIESRNRAAEQDRARPGQPPKEPEAPAKPAESKPEPVKVEEPAEHRPSRSMSRLQRAIGREQALREAAEAELAALKANAKVAAPVEELEPTRDQFASDAEYLRAAQKWDRAQELKSQSTKTAQTEEEEAIAAHLRAMDAKTTADIALLPDWDEVAAAAAEDEDAPEFEPAAHKTFSTLLARSDMRAFLLYHFAKHPTELQEMLDLTKKPSEQIRAFHRLEGRIEKVYDASKAAQADPEKGKTASTPQKPQGRAEPPQEVQQPAKPRPSSEVAARGGLTASDEPAIGSPAWMLKRNQMQFGR